MEGTLCKRRLEETLDYCALNNRKMKNFSCGDELVMDGFNQDVKGLLSLLLSAMDAFDIFIWRVKQKDHSGGSLESCYVQEHNSLRLNAIHAKMKVASRRGPGFHSSKLLQGDY